MTLAKINQNILDGKIKKEGKAFVYHTEDGDTKQLNFSGTVSEFYQELETKDFDLSYYLIQSGNTETSVGELTLPSTIPTSYDNYYFPKWRGNFVRRVNARKNLLVTGPAGSGKSVMISKLASMIGQTCIRINMHTAVSNADLIGKMTVQDNQTVFKYGYIPLAMQKGWWVILDEIDSAEPHALFRLQAVLEGSDLVVTENEGEVIKPHQNFRIFATANTKGRGDETNSYTGTNYLNASFLDRFTIFEMDYSEKEYDIALYELEDETLAEMVVQAFQLFRKAANDGLLTNSVFSTRRLISLCQAIYLGDTLKEAFDFEVLSRYSKDESKILAELLKDVFDKDHYLKKWTLGMEHKAIDKSQIVDQSTTENGVASI